MSKPRSPSHHPGPEEQAETLIQAEEAEEATEIRTHEGQQAGKFGTRQYIPTPPPREGDKQD
ncbi:MAG: hypothetical protein R3310_02110 [Candidatus Competibacteraceae bacterium]|nr:hypothetical protein [Candidatus Competibacteraceae bacterium]